MVGRAPQLLEQLRLYYRPPDEDSKPDAANAGTALDRDSKVIETAAAAAQTHQQNSQNQCQRQQEPRSQQQPPESLVNEFYTDKALLQRESLRFDPSVRAALDVIWNVTDTNGDGMIEKDEYIAMSTKLYRVIVGTKLRRAGGGTIALEEAERETMREARRVAPR